MKKRCNGQNVPALKHPTSHPSQNSWAISRHLMWIPTLWNKRETLGGRDKRWLQSDEHCAGFLKSTSTWFQACLLLGGQSQTYLIYIFSLERNPLSHSIVNFKMIKTVTVEIWCINRFSFLMKHTVFHNKLSLKKQQHINNIQNGIIMTSHLC